MISKHHRFHGYNQLTRLYRKSQTARSAYMALKYAPKPAQDKYRLAVVVSRKVHKSAVVRNRIRRRVFEAYRLALTGREVRYDLAVVVYSEQVATMPAADLQRTVRGQLRQAGIIGAKAAKGQPRTHETA
jgi:ribonuclease P protein component